MTKKILVLPSWFPSVTEPNYAPFILAQVQTLTRCYDTRVLYPEPVLWHHILTGRVPKPSHVDAHQGVVTHYERALIWLPRFPHYFYPAVYRAARRGFSKLIHDWGKPDLIHAHTVLPAGWIASRLSREAGIPVVLTEHTGPFSLHMKTAYQRQMVQETFHSVNGIIAVSPEMARQILTFQPGLKIDILGNVIQTDFFTPADNSNGGVPGKHRFLSVATLIPEKGIFDLLDAAAILVKRGVKDFEVVIVGDGPSRRSLRRTSEELGLSGICHFVGSLSHSQVKLAMQSCTVFVLPSHAETFSVAAAEAMACGKPVIATRCGGPEFYVTPENGLLVEPRQPKALAEAMQYFVSGQVRLEPQCIRGSIVQRFGEEPFLDQLEDLYARWLMKPGRMGY